MRARARSTGTAPTIKAQTLIVVQAFQVNDEGEIVPATDPVEMPDERRAIARAKELALRFVGAMAWKRLAKPDEGEFGDPEMLFSRGRLPELEMPLRQDDDGEDHGEVPTPRDGDGGGEPTWMGIQLAAAADWQAFHTAFLALYLRQEHQDLLAVFTALENRRIVLLPPVAARLVQRELPAYALRPCERPPAEVISLELGHSLQLDTTWFELSAEERSDASRRRGFPTKRSRPTTRISRNSGARPPPRRRASVDQEIARGIDARDPEAKAEQLAIVALLRRVGLS